ncbi:MAG: hypothetical protein RMN53_17235 [Anaerolineae bacterium]|nr:hypothetical protein [Anaerolineae bacterium]
MVALPWLALLILWAALLPPAARAQTPPQASVTLDAYTVAPGQPLTVNGANFLPGVIEIRLNSAVLGYAETGTGSFSRTFDVPATAAAGLGTLTACYRSACGVPGHPQNVSTPLRVLPRLSDVPAVHLRRALNFLSLLRNSTPEWAGAFFDEVAYPYFRPDIAAPAYYEFAVRSATGAPAGSIVVSTGEHDYPLAHWKPEGAPLATGLLTAANGRGLTFYKLDALTYGAETPDGQQLIRAEGAENPLLKIVGLEGVDLNTLRGTFEWTPGPDPANPSPGTLVQTGLTNTPAGLSLTEWASWPELKAGFAANYAAILEVRRQHAREDWETVRNWEQWGIPLLPGDSFTVLAAGPVTCDLTGPAAGLARVETVGAGCRVTLLTPPAAITPFEAVLATPGGQIERVRFLAAASIGHQVYLPLLASSQGRPTGRTAAATQAQSPDAPSGITVYSWHFWYADGGFPAQRLYRQIPAYTWPNTNGCWSGCGATAWAMLFGWADERAAAGNPRWVNKWGVYRQNGGVNTPNAVAPVVVDGGVNNMQMEIRSYIGGFCLFSAGPTWPWNMGGAYLYPQKRAYALMAVMGGHNFINNEWQHIADAIEFRKTPGIILTGSLASAHYPLAYGLARAWVRECGWDLFKGYHCVTKWAYPSFQINPGWGPNSPSLGSWTPASTSYWGTVLGCYWSLWQGWVCP